MFWKITNKSQLFFYLLLISIINGLFVFYPITDGDIFWHLAAGREIITKKSFIYRDPFSFIPSNSFWINVHWLFQVVEYLIEKIGGVWALLFCKSLLIVFSTFFIVLPFKKNSFQWFVITLFFANIVFFQRYLIPLRPIIFSLFIISIFIFSYEKYLKTNNKVYLLLVVLFQILWVNSQGLFLIGPIIAFSYGCGELLNKKLALRLKNNFLFRNNLSRQNFFILLIFPLLLIIVSLFNPYHIKVFSLSLRLFSQINPVDKNLFSDFVPENLPLVKMFGNKYFTYAIVTLFSFFLLIVSFFIAGSKIKFSHNIMALFGFFCAIMAQRNGILFSFLSLPALFSNFSEVNITQTRLRFVSKITIFVLSLSLVLGIFVHLRLFFLWPKPISPFSCPVESVKFLKKNLLYVNPIFNADRYGGYIIWNLYPQIQVSYDTRWSMRDKKYFKEYISTIKNPSLFKKFCDQKGFASVLLPVAPIDFYLLTAATLYNSDNWKLVFTDGIEVLFLKDSCNNYKKIDLGSSATIDSIKHELFLRFGKNQEVYKEAVGYLNRFCFVCNSLNGSHDYH